MTNKIVRTPTRAEGGITDDEKARMAVITQKWIDTAMRTEPIEPNKIGAGNYEIRRQREYTPEGWRRVAD
jgi:hypothetical protein